MTEEKEATTEDSPSAGEADAKGLGDRFRGLSTTVKVSILVPVGLVIAILILVGADMALSVGRIHPGVSVGSIAVGGMTAEEAAVAIQTAMEPSLSQPVTLTVDSSAWQVDATMLGISVDSTSAADAAYEIGRNDDFGTLVVEHIRAWLGSESVPLPLSADDGAVEDFLLIVSEVVSTPAQDASVEIDGTTARLVPSAEGSDIDHEGARELLVAAFVSEDRTVELELEPSTPRIDDESAQDALDDALEMMSADLTLTYEDKSWDVPAEEIGGWIIFRSDPETGTPSAVLSAAIASEDVSATVLPMVADVGKVATNATFKVSSGEVSVVPHEDGLAVDIEELAEELTQKLTSGVRSVELRMRRVEPAITTDDARAMNITERISTFTTEYSASNLPRVNNIHTLADALDGTLLAPGETFSFNDTIGERTAEKGYQEAPAIVNGELVPQLGGGICQVGTTIFNTVFFAGLPVVERHNHSQYISHYPKGRDATISWGGPDFKFTNDTDDWILIATGYTNSSVTISLYGTDPGYDVSYTTGDWTNIISYPVREIEDETLPEGVSIVESRGMTGRTIVVDRVVTKDGTVVREDSFKSVYRPVEEVLRVGTMPAESETTTPAE